MGRRRRTTKEIPAVAPVEPPGLPAQSGSVNVWAILAEPAVAADEVSDGKHDQCLDALEHIARSQSVGDVLAACEARRKTLTEG